MSSFFETLKSKLDIYQIVSKTTPLKKHGKDYIGLCPFHTEKTPSFRVNINKNFYYCFGCSSGGDSIGFVSKVNGITYRDAALKLAHEFGVPIPEFTPEQREKDLQKKKISNFLEVACEHFHDTLLNAKGPFAKQAATYLRDRGIDFNLMRDYQLGFASGDLMHTFASDLSHMSQAGLISRSESGQLYEIFKNRIIIPIRSKHGQLIAFGGRVMDDRMPKYLNSPETPVFKKSQALYAEDIASQHAYKTNTMLVVEGYFDCIMLHKHGFNNAVASLGTAVTIDHLTSLWKNVEEVIICMDSDSAGIKAANRIIDIALEKISPFNTISFLKLPAGLDPDAFLRKHNKEQFNDLLQSRKPFSSMLWDMCINNKIFATPESFAKLEAEISEICSKIENRFVRNNFLRDFKDRLWKLRGSQRNRSFVREHKFSKNDNKKSISSVIVGNDYLIDVDPNTATYNIEYALLAMCISWLKTTTLDTSNNAQEEPTQSALINATMHLDGSNNLLEMLNKYFMQVEFLSSGFNELKAGLQQGISAADIASILSILEAWLLKKDNSSAIAVQSFLDHLEITGRKTQDYYLFHLETLKLRHDLARLQASYLSAVSKKVQDINLIQMYVQRIKHQEDTIAKRINLK